MYKEISNIRFYSENSTMLNNWEFLYPEEEIKRTEWYKRAEDDIGVIYWDYIMDERDQKVYLSLIKGLILEAKTTVACL